jgi:hypothetical protein
MLGYARLIRGHAPYWLLDGCYLRLMYPLLQCASSGSVRMAQAMRPAGRHLCDDTGCVATIACITMTCMCAPTFTEVAKVLVAGSMRAAEPRMLMSCQSDAAATASWQLWLESSSATVVHGHTIGCTPMSFGSLLRSGCGCQAHAPCTRARQFAP